MRRRVLHLRPTAPLAPRALLPGDPGRALALAQVLLEQPRMFNHHRGLWGYTGAAADGAPLTIQSTGMGGPSAAIVLEELCDLGLEVAVRVGTCTALDPELALGDLVVVRKALAGDGASRALGADERVVADAALAQALAAAAGAGSRSGLVACGDLFYDPAPERAEGWRAQGALALDLEAAALLQTCVRRGIRGAALLAVTGTEDERLDEEGVTRAGERMGNVAAAALDIPER